MPRMVITHDVVDIERWLKGKERAGGSDRVGRLERHRPRRARTAATAIAVTADIHDLDALQAMLDSPPPEIAAQMEAHGVLPPLTAYLEK